MRKPEVCQHCGDFRWCCAESKKQAEAEGAASMKARIVAWLRRPGQTMHETVENDKLVAAIERWEAGK